MSRITVSNLLRFALRLDAVASAASGLLMAAAAGPLAIKLGLPQPLLLSLPPQKPLGTIRFVHEYVH